MSRNGQAPFLVILHDLLAQLPVESSGLGVYYVWGHSQETANSCPKGSDPFFRNRYIELQRRREKNAPDPCVTSGAIRRVADRSTGDTTASTICIQGSTTIFSSTTASVRKRIGNAGFDCGIHCKGDGDYST